MSFVNCAVASAGSVTRGESQAEESWRWVVDEGSLDAMGIEVGADGIGILGSFDNVRRARPPIFHRGHHSPNVK